MRRQRGLALALSPAAAWWRASDAVKAGFQTPIPAIPAAAAWLRASDAVKGLLGWVLVACALAGLPDRVALAQSTPARTSTIAPAPPAVGFDERLFNLLPMNAPFADEAEGRVVLADYLRARPAIVALGYYGCSNLCSAVLDGVAHALDVAGLAAGRDLDVIAVSIDPLETPELARRRKVQVLGEGISARADAGGWHFLTGAQPAIDDITEATGFRYARNVGAMPDNAFAHAAGIMLVSTGGHLIRYFPGVAFAPDDLRAGIKDAAAERVGQPSALSWLLCFHFDPQTGRYTPVAMNIVRLAAGIVFAALAGWILRALLLGRHPVLSASQPRVTTDA